MRRWIIILFLAVILIGFVALLVSLRPRQASVKLADGSILTVQKVAFGKSEDLAAASWWETLKQRIIEKLPRAWAQRFLPATPRNINSRWSTSAMSYNAGVDGLQIYFNRRDAAGKFREVLIYTGEIADDHGCVMVPSALSGSDNGRLPPGTTSGSGGFGSSITRLTFQNFPRQQKEFRIRLYDVTRQFMGEVTARNPLWPPKPRANLIPENFPITRHEGDVTYTLVGFGIITNWVPRSNASPREFGLQFRGPFGLDPQFEVRVRGQLVTDWTIDDMDLFDTSGNIAPKQSPLRLFLCTNEPAWQLKVKFAGPFTGSPDSNGLITLKNVAVPAPGDFRALTDERVIHGVQIKFLGISGPGEVFYSNGVPILATTIANPPASLTWEGSTGAGVARYRVRSSTSVIALQIGNPPATDQWMTVVAYDQRGRRFEAFPHGRGVRGAVRPPAAVKLPRIPTPASDIPTFLNLDLPPDVRTVNVVVALEGSSTEEFIFKPPAGK